MNNPRSVAVWLLATLVCANARADDDLAWLAGDWCSGENGETIEESWLPARGGEMFGVSRTMRGERLGGFEFLRISAASGVPTYLAQPGGAAATAFVRSDGGDDWIRFENRSHDFPQRIEYRVSGAQLLAEVSGPGDGGEWSGFTITFTRCPAR